MVTGRVIEPPVTGTVVLHPVIGTVVCHNLGTVAGTIYTSLKLFPGLLNQRKHVLSADQAQPEANILKSQVLSNVPMHYKVNE